MARPSLTRWSVRLTDPERERRFVQVQLPLQRRTALMASVALIAMTIGEWAYRGLAPHDTMSAADPWVLGGSFAVGLALAAALASNRLVRRTAAALAGAVVGLPVMVAALIYSGVPVGSQGTLLVVGGVVVVYFSARVEVVGTVIAALVYCAVTVPVWLASGVATSGLDVAYTSAAALLAHVVGVAEVRRAMREARLAFAHRETLRRLSSIDALTELTNRRAFGDRLDAVWSEIRRRDAELALVMIDIDHFKLLNDTRGHAAGDVALRMVADAIRRALPPGENVMAARYGGEEFVVLLPEVGSREACSVAEAVRAAVRDAAIPAASLPPTIGAGTPAPLTVSVGVAMATPTMLIAEELVNAADRELYRAKSAGRDCVRGCERAEAAA